MKTKLIQAGLWQKDEAELELNISTAWSIMAHLGYPGRYAGKAQDGSYEYLILNPLSGELLASGKGSSLESAICAAALNAQPLVNRSQEFR